MASERQAYHAWLNRGHDAAWAGDWQGAATAYRRAIAEWDGDALAHLDLGLALFEQGDLRAALPAYQRALQLNPGDEAALHKVAEIHSQLGEKLQAASTYLLLADSHMRARQPAQAVRAWQQVVRHDPMNQVAYRRLADAYRRGRRDDLAAQATLALARVQAELGQRTEAIALAQQALQLHPDLTGAHQLLGSLNAPAHAAGPMARTTGPLRRLTGPLRRPTGPLDGNAGTVELDFLGVAQESEGVAPAPTDAAQQRALARLAETFFEGGAGDPNLEALKARAIDLQTRGLVEEAARGWEEILAAGGGSGELFYTLGTLYQTMLRLDDAARAFERAAGSPDFTLAARFAIGQCRQSQGRMDEALAAFQAALRAVDLRAVPDEQVDEVARVLEGLADAYQAKGDFAQADHHASLLADFLTSRGWEDKLADLRARLGGGVGDLSVAELLESAASEPVLAAMEASAQYQANGSFRAAIDELYWALPLAPDYLPLHSLLAELFLASGRPDDAVAKLVEIAEVYLARSNLSQAIRAMKRALDIAPVDQNARGRLIDLLLSHGEVDEALDHFLRLADGFYQLAQGDRAIEKLNEALRLAPRGTPERRWALQIQRRLADIHAQRLDWRRATAAYESIVALAPDDAAAAQQLVDLLFRTGQEERARALIETVADRLLEQQGIAAMLRFMQGQRELRPQDATLARALGERQASVGDVDGAAQSWERAAELLARAGQRAQAAGLLRRILGLRPPHEARYRAMLAQLMKQG